MTHSLPSSPDPLNITPASTHETPHAVPAIIEWKDNEGQSHYVGCSPNNPANLFFHFDAPTKTGSFKLSVAFAWRKIGTRVQRRTAPLYLCLQLSHLRRLSLDDLSCPSPHDEFLRPLGHDLACVSVELTGFPVLLAPDWPLTPQNRSHNPAMDSVKRIAQLSAFNIYVQRGSALATDDLRLLCTAVANSEAWPDDDPRDTTEFYHGRRGKVIGVDLLAPDAGSSKETQPSPTQDPPAYHSLEPSPPMAPLTGSKKRRHASLDSEATRDEAGAEALPRKTLGDELALIRDRMELLEQRASASEQARDDASRRVEDLEQRLVKVECERDSARGQIKDLESQIQDLVRKEEVEQLNEDLQALEAHIDERVWVEVDDLRSTVHSDFDDLQQELRCDVADLVRDALEEAVQSQLAIADIRVRDGILEVCFDNN